MYVILYSISEPLDYGFTEVSGAAKFWLHTNYMIDFHNLDCTVGHGVLSVTGLALTHHRMGSYNVIVFGWSVDVQFKVRDL